MEERSKARILCVDDDPQICEGLALTLGKFFEVHTASTAETALRKLVEVQDLAVIVSDMRMPKMDGATFLHQAVIRRPGAARILLTGHAEKEAAIRAVNEGQIFRFLTKPCPRDQLKEAIDAGVVQHRLYHAERAVLQETLVGSIGAMMEVLAIANPVAFARAGQIKRRAMELAGRMGAQDFWQLEAAAMLCQVGYAALEPALLEKYYQAEPLSAEEQEELAAVPDLAEKLLEHIPRLEPVIQIIAALKWSDDRVAALGEGTVGLGTRILGLILEYDALIARGISHARACEQLSAKAGRFGASLISQLDEFISLSDANEETILITLAKVEPGMVLQEELRNPAGVLLVPRGFVVTRGLTTRLETVAPALLETSVKVRVKKQP